MTMRPSLIWACLILSIGILAAPHASAAGNLQSATPPIAPTAASTNEGETDSGIAKGGSGLHVPRFASLRSGEVNMRTGPGTRYPIEWVLTRKGLPVEIFAEFEVWRRVRDPDGSEGWVHKSALSGKRAAIITGAPRDLKDHGDPQSDSLAHLEVGAVGSVLSCDKEWCKLKFDGIKGYLPKSDFWGTYPNESFD